MAESQKTVADFRLKWAEKFPEEAGDPDSYTNNDCQYTRASLGELYGDIAYGKVPFEEAESNLLEEGELKVLMDHAEKCRNFTEERTKISCRSFFELIRQFPEVIKFL